MFIYPSFEKNKTRDFGKLPMKHIDYLKNLFLWNQVFAKKRYFDDKGMETKGRCLKRKEYAEERRIVQCNDFVKK